MKISRRSMIKALSALAVLPVYFPLRAYAAAPMRIGVIGAGSLGGTVGRIWVEAGHEVMFSSRHPEELQAMAQELGPRASVGLSTAAAEFGTVLLLAVPYEAIPQLGRDLSQSTKGKIVLDACNPPLFGGWTSDLIIEARRNGVALTTAKHFPGARVVRAFSCVDATVIETSATRPGGRVAIPIASDDPRALDVAASLASMLAANLSLPEIWRRRQVSSRVGQGGG